MLPVDLYAAATEENHGDHGNHRHLTHTHAVRLHLAKKREKKLKFDVPRKRNRSENRFTRKRKKGKLEAKSTRNRAKQAKQ
jgi:hypothetical protein